MQRCDLEDTNRRCKACGGMNVVMFLAHTTVGDESMNQILMCTSCGNRWIDHLGGNTN